MKLTSNRSWLNILLAAAVSVAAATAMGNAEAKRLGGGKSVGKQGTAQRDAAPAAGAAAPTAAAAAAPAAAGAAGAAAAATKKPWGGMLGGLAAGLGIAALFSYLGMGGQLASMMGSLLMVLLLVGAGFFIWRMLRKPAAGTQPGQPAFGAAGAGTNTNTNTNTSQFRAASPDNTYTGGIGGEAMTQRFDAAGAPVSAIPGVPADFDVPAFLDTSKKHYVRLQQAWDVGDLTALKQFCDDATFAELKAQIDARGGVDKTDVVTLEARLLGMEKSFGNYIASVEFSGLVREETFGSASAFREVWNLSKPAEGGGGWLLVGIEQLGT